MYIRILSYAIVVPVIDEMAKSYFEMNDKYRYIKIFPELRFIVSSLCFGGLIYYWGCLKS